MEIEIDFAVHKFFPKASFIQVYFEAVANALDAGADEVSIQISSRGTAREPDFDLVISDNGDGFTDRNFEQFRRLQAPKDATHKGLGRLVYMSYFDRVEVESFYEEGARAFTFSRDFDGTFEEVQPQSADTGTTLRFRGFKRKRLSSYDDLRPGSIRQKLIQQFFPLLHERKSSGKPLTITIKLDTTEIPQQDFAPDVQRVTEKSVPTLESREVDDPDLPRFSNVVLKHRVEADSATPGLMVAASVDGRTIPMDLISPKALPATTSAIFIVETALFAGKSDSARERLELPEDVPMSVLARALRREIGSILEEACPAIAERNTQTEQELDSRYPHLIGLFDEERVGLVDRDELLESGQRRFLEKQKTVLTGDPMDDDTFHDALEISARALTEYVLYRQQIISRLKNTSESQRESAVHELFVPQRRQFDEAALVDDLYLNNAWLLDDKFMTFRTILSEAEMREIISAITLGSEADDRGRPDIALIFNADPNEAEKVDVVVVELKKREVNDKEGTYAAMQLLKRARKLVEHCPNIQRVWYFAVIEFDDALRQLLVDDEWVPLFSKGVVLYKNRTLRRTADRVPVPCPSFFLSFDAIVDDAAARNHTFLELLRSGFKRVARSSSEEANEIEGPAPDTPATT